MGNKLNSKQGVIVVIIGILVILGGLYLFYNSDDKEEPLLFEMSATQSVDENQRLTDKSLVYLYFADKENTYLMAEERAVFHIDNPAEFGQVIIKELIKGPDRDLMRTIPEHTVLNALYVTNTGTAFVDMSEEIKENHPRGVQMELMTIYSIVNSLVLNIPEIKTVKILIQGRESMTLAGHIDLRFPFKANMILVR